MKQNNKYCRVARTYYAIYKNSHNGSIEEMNAWLKEKGYNIQYPYSSLDFVTNRKKFKWGFIGNKREGNLIKN